jgi:hypothetical protein
MSISSISSSSSSSLVQAVAPPSVQSPGATDATAAGGVTVDISKPGQLFSDLSSLAQSDPDKFKSVTADIAQKLKDAAAGESGGKADFLNKLADRFSAASQSGSAADLTPNAGQARGAGHHHHGGSSGHRAHAAGAGGGDADGSLAQTIQGIISGALDSTTAVAT